MVPVIDLSDMSHDNCTKLIEAGSKCGVMLIKNHLLNKEEVDELFRIGKEFFDLPDNEKKKYPITEGNYGYVPPFTEDIGDGSSAVEFDGKEAFNITDFDLSSFKPKHVLPTTFGSNINFISSCLRKYYVMVHIICRMLAIGLDIKGVNDQSDPDFFVSAHALNMSTFSTLRFSHYPRPQHPNSEIITGAHSSYGSLTFVLQRPQSGFQFLFNGEWVDLDSSLKNCDNEEYLILSIADILSYWTNGILKSEIHRVRTTQERYSLVFYCHPADDCILESIKSDLLAEHKKVLKNNGTQITAYTFLKDRLKRGFKRIG